MKTKLKKIKFLKFQKIRSHLKLLISFSLILTLPISSQSLEGKCWKNSFGSLAYIKAHNTLTGKFTGVYGSTTGSSGYYAIIGKTAPLSSNNQNYKYPLTFTIGWGSINTPPGDNSQYWTSSMSGVYNTNDNFKLLNVISAPGPFDDVKIFQPANLPQTQSFSLVDAPADKVGCDELKNQQFPPVITNEATGIYKDYENLIKGDWNVDEKNSIGIIKKIAIDSLVPRGQQYDSLIYYEISGSLIFADKSSIDFTGILSPFIRSQADSTSDDSSINSDTPTDPGIDFKSYNISEGNEEFSFSISIVGTSLDAKSNISLSGYFDGKTSNTLNMFLLDSKANTEFSIDANKISSGELFIKNNLKI